MSRAASKPALSIVQPSTSLDMADDIYRHDRAKMLDRDHWANVHIRADQSRPIHLPQFVKRLVLGHGVRTERGGFVSEKRP